MSQLLFGLDDCGVSNYRSEEERQFLERLDERAKLGRWDGDAWRLTPDRTVFTVTICRSDSDAVEKTLKVEYAGNNVLVGYDSTNSHVEDLCPNDPKTRAKESSSVTALADFAADWIEKELALCTRENGTPLFFAILRRFVWRIKK